MAAAKEAFNAAFAAAEAGEHAALRPDALHPVNNDVQAPQIGASYLDDVEDVAAAKAAFQVCLMKWAVKDKYQRAIPGCFR